MNPISWIAEKVATIAAQLIGSAVVMKIESDAIRHKAVTVSELTKEARSQEEDGNPELAQMLRQKAAALIEQSDSAMPESSPESLPQKIPVAPTPKNIESGEPAKRRRGRPKKSNSGKNSGGDSK